jgi:hypothetical protein
MYVMLFGVGFITAIFAVVRGFQAGTGTEAAGALVLAGLSAASFFSLFLIRPLESLERNSIYASWMTAAMNTYWTRLIYFSDAKTIDKALKGAIEDLVRDLAALADKHRASIGNSAIQTATRERKTAPDNRGKKGGTH